MQHIRHVRIHRMEFLIGSLRTAGNVPAMTGDFNRPCGAVRIQRINELPIAPVDIGMDSADDMRGGNPRARAECVCAHNGDKIKRGRDYGKRKFQFIFKRGNGGT
jgi:hypothetical protein